MRLAPVIALMLLLAGCRDADAPDESVLARIDDRVITVEQFKRELKRRAGSVSGGYGSREQQEALLTALVERERLLATAEALELDQDPAVRDAIERVLTSAVRRELEERSIAGVEVSEAEVRAWYEAHRADYERPERRNAAIIYSSSATDADRSRLQSVRQQAMAGETRHFGELALDHSDDRSSRYRGGVIGWLSEDRRERYKWPTPVVDAIFSLETEGAVSELIETEDGLFLVRLVALDPGGARPLEEIESGIRASLRREKVQQARKQAMEQLTGGIEVQVYQDRLDQIEPELSSDTERKPPALPGRSN